MGRSLKALEIMLQGGRGVNGGTTRNEGGRNPGMKNLQVITLLPPSMEEESFTIYTRKNRFSD